MKKELLASVLTLTAGMASTITFPQTALARSTTIEKQFAKNFVLKTQNPARMTEKDGTVIMGYIYLKLEQTPFTPEYQNRLHGEMTGRLYFESDDYTHEYNGQKYKTAMDLAGDDGGVLLDLMDASEDNESTYQIYGCNSTRTHCLHEKYELFIGGKQKITMNLNLGSQNIEILETYQQNQQWSSEAYSVPMTEVVFQ
ncbi:hypothetical protein [Bdellovibrio sp. HCB337]|uniref:hypothetical protein n=1 Tax=Bdellovibrio sp. HCB337 TaxID=3394358 RepID=UPI0039A668E5